MKPVASLSLDLDNQWSYMKTHGDPGWEKLPSYLPVLVPRVLDFLAERGLRITFFIVGQDAVLPGHGELLARLTEAGHEVGNHSFHHEPWLHRYSRAQLEDEIERAEIAIRDATGVRTEGFRGPGYSLSETVLEVLAARGYRYDASTLPTYLGPLARAYYFLQADLTPEQKEERSGLFGSFRDGLRPVKPYRWRLEGDGLLEIPVTTMPAFKLPFHLSYLLYLSDFSQTLARTYLAVALRACRLYRLEPSLLMHPLDFLGADDVDALGFFPGMRQSGAVKRARVAEYLADVAAVFEPVTMGQHAAALSERPQLARRTPAFAQP
ncbi:MAG: polysaccharide deacetylase family protein [Proteobacteria bacterium]|nr:polysaccharide deacetylase family protein [Pseudomonadota bacterium]